MEIAYCKQPIKPMIRYPKIFLFIRILCMSMLCGCSGAQSITEADMEDVEKRRMAIFSDFLKQSKGAAKFVRLFPESHYFVKVEDEELELYEISITSYFGGRFKITMIQPKLDASSIELKMTKDFRVRLEEILEIVPLPAERFKLKHGRSWNLDVSQWNEITSVESLMKLVDVDKQKPTDAFELYQNHMLNIYSDFKVPRN